MTPSTPSPADAPDPSDADTLATAEALLDPAEPSAPPEPPPEPETVNAITVVGCGFVGSVFSDEFLKRAFAGKLPQALRYIDDDTVDDRNCANQNFFLYDKGTPKARVLADRAMRSGKQTEALVCRLAPESMDVLLRDSTLIVDAVDNLATRQLLWTYAMTRGVPVLHIGISELGTGKVEWTHPAHDTFSLAPKHTFGKTLVDPPSGVTPPCELARMRGVGINVGFAAAMAAAIAFGFDPEAHLHGEPSTGWLTDWAATPASHFPIRETWGRVAWAADADALAVPAGV